MLDCTGIDQWLMLTRAFDLTSLLQHSNLLCIQIRVLPRPDPQLFSSSGFRMTLVIDKLWLACNNDNGSVCTSLIFKT